MLKRLVDDGFERYVLRAAIGPIAGNDGGGLRIVHSIGDAMGTESAKDHGMNGTHSGTGQNGNRQFGDHAHIDTNAISFFDTAASEYLGKDANGLVQLFIRIFFALFVWAV